MSGVSFQSGGVVAPVPCVPLPTDDAPTAAAVASSSLASASSSSAPLPVRCLLYLRAGSCVLQATVGCSPDTRCPLRVARLGFLLVSLQGHLCARESDAQRLRLVGQRVLSLRGAHVSAVALVSEESLRSRAERAGVHFGSPRLQRAIAGAALVAELQSVHLHLRLLLRAAEETFGADFGTGQESLFEQLNARHQRLMDEMLRSDGIHKQMQAQEDEEKAQELQSASASSSTSAAADTNKEPDPLSNTRTIAQLVGLESFAQRLLSRGDLRARWFGDLFSFDASVLPSSSGGAAAAAAPLPARSALHSCFLVSPASPAGPPTILLFYAQPQWTAWNLAGPSNEGMWRVVLEYARALCTKSVATSADASDPSAPVALSFPLSSPPLIVYLSPVRMPAGGEHGACLIVVEVGPSIAAVDHSRCAHGASAPGAIQWIDPLQLVSAASLASVPVSPLLPRDHPLSQEQLRRVPRPFAVLTCEAQLPPWHSGAISLQPQEQGQESKEEEEEKRAAQPSVWARVQATVRRIAADSALPDPRSLMVHTTLGGEKVSVVTPEPLASPVAILSDLSSPSATNPSPASSTLDDPLVALSPLSSPASALSSSALAPVHDRVRARAREQQEEVRAELHPFQPLPSSPAAPPARSSEQTKRRAEEEEEKSNMAATSATEPAPAPAVQHFRPIPPSQPAPPLVAAPPMHGAPSGGGGGTASFRRRKMYPAGTVAPSSMQMDGSTVGPEEKTAATGVTVPSLPLAPLERTGSFGTRKVIAAQLPGLLLRRSSGGAAIAAAFAAAAAPSALQPQASPVELSMDTPRLATSIDAQSPRIVAAPPRMGSSVFPPLHQQQQQQEKRAISLGLPPSSSSLLSKLQQQAEEKDAF